MIVTLFLYNQLEKILNAKKWDNILLREKIRNEITNKIESVNEKETSVYLNRLSCEELIELRQRLFKLARDHYTEYLLKQFSKPLLTPHSTANIQK